MVIDQMQGNRHLEAKHDSFNMHEKIKETTGQYKKTIMSSDKFN